MIARGLCSVAAAAALAISAASSTPTGPPPASPAYEAPLATKAPLLGVARAGARLVAVGDHGVVVLSDDEGRNWRQAGTVPTRQMLTAVTFVDAKRGFAVGH